MIQMSSKNVPSVKIFDKYRFFLAAALKLREISQRDLAQMLGVVESQVSRWINSEGKPVKITRQKVCEVLRLQFKEEPGKFYLIDLDQLLVDRFERGLHPLPGTEEPRETYAAPDLESVLKLLESIETLARVAARNLRKLKP